MFFKPLFLKKFSFFFLSFLLSIGSVYSSPFQNISIEEAKRQAIKENKLIFTHFYADWCISCLQMEKSIYSDEAVIKKLEENFITVKIQVDNTLHKSWKENYGVYVLPTILFTHKTGVEIKRKQKQISKSEFLQLISEIILLKPEPTPTPIITQNNTIEKKIVRYPITKPMPSFTTDQKSIVSNENLNAKPISTKTQSTLEIPLGTVLAEEISDELFVIQVAAYFKHHQAQELVDELTSLQYEDCKIVLEYTNNRSMYKVILGEYQSIKTARLHLLDIQDSGYEAYIKHI